MPPHERSRLSARAERVAGRYLGAHVARAESAARAGRRARGWARNHVERLAGARAPCAGDRAGRNAVGRGDPDDDHPAGGLEPDRRRGRRGGRAQHRPARRAGARAVRRDARRGDGGGARRRAAGPRDHSYRSGGGGSAARGRGADLGRRGGEREVAAGRGAVDRRSRAGEPGEGRGGRGDVSADRLLAAARRGGRAGRGGAPGGFSARDNRRAGRDARARAVGDRTRADWCVCACPLAWRRNSDLPRQVRSRRTSRS